MICVSSTRIGESIQHLMVKYKADLEMFTTISILNVFGIDALGFFRHNFKYLQTSNLM